MPGTQVEPRAPAARTGLTCDRSQNTQVGLANEAKYGNLLAYGIPGCTVSVAGLQNGPGDATSLRPIVHDYNTTSYMPVRLGSLYVVNRVGFKEEDVGSHALEH